MFFLFQSVDLPVSRESSETSSNRSGGSLAGAQPLLSRLLPQVPEQEPVPSVGRPLHKSFLKSSAAVLSSQFSAAKGLPPAAKELPPPPFSRSSTAAEERREVSVEPTVIELYRPSGSTASYPYVYFKKEASPSSPSQEEYKDFGGKEERVYHYPVLETPSAGRIPGGPLPAKISGRGKGLGYSQGIREEPVTGPTSSSASLTPRLTASYR